MNLAGSHPKTLFSVLSQYQPCSVMSESNCMGQNFEHCNTLTRLNKKGLNEFINSSIELARVITTKSTLTFRIVGSCMYPILKPGDVLYIEPSDIASVAVGDIIVFRQNNQWICHRTVSKENLKGRIYINTKADRAIYADNAAVYDEEMLGIVTRVERKGKKRSVRQQHSWLIRFYSIFYLKLYAKLQMARKSLIEGLTNLQDTAIYRKIAQVLFVAAHRNLTYIVQLPFHSHQVQGFCQQVTLDMFENKHFKTMNNELVNHWTLSLVVTDTIKSIASVSFISRPPLCPFSGWWCNQLHVRLRYRGIAVEKLLIHKAEQIFTHNGVTELLVNMNMDSSTTENRFKALGFCYKNISFPKGFNADTSTKPVYKILHKNLIEKPYHG